MRRTNWEPVDVHRAAPRAAVMEEARAALRTPARLLEWDVEAEHCIADRHRMELRLSLALVLLLRSGDGGPEARVLALSRIYSRHRAAPALALLLAERLLRSRLVVGATDVETFWLAATFCGPLDAVAAPELRRLTWLYLCHAPFALDPFTLLRFCRASITVQEGQGEPQALKLGRTLLQIPEQTELGRALLESLLCATLRVSRIEKAVVVLWEVRQGMPGWFPALVQLLAEQYVRACTGSFVGREVVRVACVIGQGTAQFRTYLREGLFSLPVAELYRWVRLNAQRSEVLDARQRAYSRAGLSDSGRLLLECELVFRLAPWRMGRFAPAFRTALRRVLGGADVFDPRIRELAFRWVQLCAESWQYSEEAHHLARRILVLPHYQPFLQAPSELEAVLREFLQESRPLSLLAREQALLLEPSYPRQAGRPGVASWTDEELGELQLIAEGAPERAEGPEIEGGWGPRLERMVYPGFRLACRGRWVRRLIAQVEGVAGVRIEQIGPAELARLSALARAFAWSDRRMAATVGAVAGFAGGRSGFLVDLAGFFVTSVRAVVRIGACYGIAPGSRDSLRFLGDVLRQVFSPDSAARGLSWWLAQRPRIYRMAALGLALRVSQRSRLPPRDQDARGVSRWVRQLHRLPRIPGRARARVLPLGAGGVAAAVDYLLMRELTDAALQLGARHWALERQRDDLELRVEGVGTETAARTPQADVPGSEGRDED